MGMNEIQISSQEPKGGNAQFLQDAERNAAYFGKFKLGYFMHIGPGSEETCKFETYPDNPQRKWEELAKQVTEVNTAQKHPITKGYPKRRAEARWCGHPLRRQ